MNIFELPPIPSLGLRVRNTLIIKHKDLEEEKIKSKSILDVTSYPNNFDVIFENPPHLLEKILDPPLNGSKRRFNGLNAFGSN